MKLLARQALRFDAYLTRWPDTRVEEGTPPSRSAGWKEQMRYAMLLLVPLCLSGCGGEDSTGPSSDFPRAFTASSESCVRRVGLQIDNAQGVYVETTVLSTVERSVERLFSGEATIYLVRSMSFSGVLVDEEYTGEYRPSAVDGTWDVTLTAGPEVGSFLATGSGTGEMSGRSIDFDMEPLSDGCGYTSSGTIR